MDARDFRDRTKLFAMRVIRLLRSLPRNRTADVIADQLLRAATSVAANYRAACRARSRREFVARLGIVEEEADEALLWLELLAESGEADGRLLADLRTEANELVALAVSSIRTARRG